MSTSNVVVATESGPASASMFGVNDKTRVLVVDDEKLLASMLALVLVKNGYDALAAFNGNDAIAAAQNFHPDILITDYNMPGMTGLDAASEIKRMCPAVRVVVLTGATELVRPGFLDRTGYSFHHMVKPIATDELVRLVQSQVEFAHLGVDALILNVDDVEVHRYSISRLLSRAGFRVIEAGTAIDAWNKTIWDRPDLILLDVHLPDLDGYALCRRLKSDPERNRIPVIHFTATDATESGFMQSRNSGADMFLVQPIEPAVLVRNIRSLLAERLAE